MRLADDRRDTIWCGLARLNGDIFHAFDRKTRKFRSLDYPKVGNRYDANDPHSQLWIHMTAWHSILYAYERYGPGKLSPAEEAQYWEECAVAAELQQLLDHHVPEGAHAA